MTERQSNRGFASRPGDAESWIKAPDLPAGAAFLRELHDLYGSPGFLAAYNAGPGRYEEHLATGRPLPDETRAYVAAIAPLIGEGRIENAIAIASVARSWTEGPIFVGQAEGAPGVDEVSASVQPIHSPGSRRAVDMSALVPRSDRLFVRVSAQERPR